MSQAGLAQPNTSLGATTYTTMAGNAAPAAGVLTILGTNGITTSAAAGTVTISTTGQSIHTWSTVGVSGALVNNNGYLCIAGAALTFSLPVTAAIGTQISIVLAGSASWEITQGAGQSISISPLTTTPGVVGKVISLTPGTSLTIICDVADTHWTAISSTGTFTIV